MTDRLRADGLDQRLVQSRLVCWSTRGRVYALPHDVHPVMLAYRRDLVEAFGIDVSKLTTWDKFVEVGRQVSRDLDGDGIVDRYMLDMRYDGNWALQVLMFQRGGQVFDPQGEVAFATEDNAQLIRWYIEQTRGPHKIGYECGWGQPVVKAMTDGLVLFHWAPDWRSWDVCRRGTGAVRQDGADAAAGLDPGGIWNMMMSMSGSWFFVVASEAISVGNTTITLPGVGSYIALAIEHQDLAAVGWAILTMLIVILIYDQLVFRPLVAWADRFRFEQEAGVFRRIPGCSTCCAVPAWSTG